MKIQLIRSRQVLIFFRFYELPEKTRVNVPPATCLRSIPTFRKIFSFRSGNARPSPLLPIRVKSVYRRRSGRAKKNGVGGGLFSSFDMENSGLRCEIARFSQNATMAQAGATCALQNAHE